MTKEDKKQPPAEFDADACRASVEADARDYVQKNGWQAVVFASDGDRLAPIWEGQKVHPERHEAVATAEKYVEAYVAQQAKIFELRSGRRASLGPDLSKVLSELDEIKVQASALSSRKKAKNDELERLVREAEEPEVSIEFQESLGYHMLTVVQGGEVTKIDDRQQELALEPDEVTPFGDSANEAEGAESAGGSFPDPSNLNWPDDEDDGGPFDGE